MTEDPTHVLGDLADWADRRAPDRPTDVTLVELCRACESPAERALLVACIGIPPDIRVTAQRRIGHYRADFAFERGNRRLVVEVDGHRWHQAEAEQVARDHARSRYMLARDWPTMRFTAIETLRDAPTCVSEIVAYLTAGEGER